MPFSFEIWKTFHYAKYVVRSSAEDEYFGLFFLNTVLQMKNFSFLDCWKVDILQFVESLIMNYFYLYLSTNSYCCFLTEKQDLFLTEKQDLHLLLFWKLFY